MAAETRDAQSMGWQTPAPMRFVPVPTAATASHQQQQQHPAASCGNETDAPWQSRPPPRVRFGQTETAPAAQIPSACWSSMSVPPGTGTAAAANLNPTSPRWPQASSQALPAAVAAGTPMYPLGSQQPMIHVFGSSTQSNSKSARSSSWSPAMPVDQEAEVGIEQQQQYRLRAWKLQIPADLPLPLIDGQQLSVGKSFFVVGNLLGEGTYARVWSATRELKGSRDSESEAAIKEMRCGEGYGVLPGATLARALFEVSAMQELELHGHACKEAIRAPRVIDHQVWPCLDAPGTYLMRVAMSRCRGKPLDVWLDSRCASIAASRGQQPTVDVRADWCESLLEAVGIAGAMMRQLAPTFERLNTCVAFHRDVNSRNILVHCAEPEPEEQAGALEFSLVDFGAARAKANWLAGSGDGSWREENPTGDARYWGPASWARMQEGPEALETDSALRWQYAQGLDMVALATCALEAFCRLQAAGRSDEAKQAAAKAPEGLEKQLPAAVQCLQHSWSEYWSLSLSSFTALAKYSAEALQGGQRALLAWDELLKQDTPRTLRVKLRALCSDLAGLAALCPAAAEASAAGCLPSMVARTGPRFLKAAAWIQAGKTLSALQEMLSESSNCTWDRVLASLQPEQSKEGPLAESASPERCNPKEPQSPLEKVDLSSPQTVPACNLADAPKMVIAASMAQAGGPAMPAKSLLSIGEEVEERPQENGQEAEQGSEETAANSAAITGPQPDWAECFKGLAHAAKRSA